MPGHRPRAGVGQHTGLAVIEPARIVERVEVGPGRLRPGHGRGAPHPPCSRADPRAERPPRRKRSADGPARAVRRRRPRSRATPGRARRRPGRRQTGGPPWIACSSSAADGDCTTRELHRRAVRWNGSGRASRPPFAAFGALISSIDQRLAIPNACSASSSLRLDRRGPRARPDFRHRSGERRVGERLWAPSRTRCAGISPAPETEAAAREPVGGPVTVRTPVAGPGTRTRRSSSDTRAEPQATATAAAAPTISADRPPRASPRASTASSGRWSAAATSPASAARTTAGGRSEGDMAAQRRQPGRADAGNLIEVGDRAKSAVRRAVVDDPLASAGRSRRGSRAARAWPS